MTAVVPGVAVVAVEASRVRIPFRRPFVTSAGTWHVRHAWIVRIRDASGRVGVGEASLAPSATPGDLDALAVAVRSVVPGLATPGAMGSWLAEVSAATDETVTNALRAAFVGAALDLGLLPWPGAGRAVAAPSVRVNATIATEDPGLTVQAARDAVGAGFTSLKVKGGGEPSGAALVERLTAVRAAVGPAVGLRLDVNGAWDVGMALERASALASLGIEYIEQPIAAGDPRALATVRAGSPVPIAADESVTSPSGARALLDARAADVLVIKPARVGGALAALEIARSAAEAGVGVTVSTLLETGVGSVTALHVAARLPGDGSHAHGLATADVLVSDLLATPQSMTTGRITVPGEVGVSAESAGSSDGAAGSSGSSGSSGEPGGGRLGIVLDDVALERWTVERVGSEA